MNCMKAFEFVHQYYNPDELIEPKWLIKKFGVLNEIDKEMVRRASYQGIKA